MKKMRAHSAMYLSILVGTAAVASAAYATTSSDDGSSSSGAVVAPEAPARDAAPLQVPPDVRIQKLAFTNAKINLVRSVITSSNNPSGPLYGAGFEYWSGNTGQSVTNFSQLTMSSSTSQMSEADILSYLVPSASWGPEFAITQVIGTQGWTQGTYQTSAAQARLFKAVDPDNSSRYIGLLIEQDASNTLERITWYKSGFPTGTIFAQTPASLTFSVVKDSSLQPSLDPNDIDPQVTWYYASGP